MITPRQGGIGLSRAVSKAANALHEDLLNHTRTPVTRQGSTWTTLVP